MPSHPVESGNECGTDGGGKENYCVWKGDFNSFGPHGEALYHHLADKETDSERSTNLP